ncbi:MAG: VWA domain-containing protein, partial [Pseudomonadales bacterium]|nr:VWA domain-containing protein [Pseudomonadales bacterium]
KRLGITNDRGTDVVVLLDRSGSMGTPEKLPYAKTAVKELLDQIGERDRFSLVSFSDRAVIEFPLSTVNDQMRKRISKVVDGVSSGGGTNIHHGVDTAWKIIQDNPSARTRKVILLSDGEATSGDTSATGLYRVSALANQREGMLSTIGMGLGFNETVMSSMADHGMGRFAYLESLEQLGSILAKDFDDAKHTFAANSHLQIELKPGVELIDAGGYPITYVKNNGRTIANVTTGRLLSDATKSFVLTLRVPSESTGEFDLSGMALTYTANGEVSSVSLPKKSLQLAIVEPARKIEALASIDKASYASVWTENNVGRMRQSVNNYIRKGEKAKAKKVIQSYRNEIQVAEQESGVALVDAVAEELNKMDSELDEAFSGPAPVQRVKRNRLAKKSHADSLKSQRKLVK